MARRKTALSLLATAALAGTGALGGVAVAAPGTTTSTSTANYAQTSPREASLVDQYDPQLELERCISDEEITEYIADLDAEIAEELASDNPDQDYIDELQSYTDDILSWANEYCGEATVPVDYDDPTGATYQVPVFQMRSADPSKKLGTLFVNPGGPGGSATALAMSAPFFLSDDILDRFDVVGVEPRQQGEAQAGVCFPTAADQIEAVRSAMDSPYPVTDQQWADFYLMAKDYGQACASNAPMMSASTTTEYVRDMEVVRQAIGAEDVNFLGFSYGTYVGQVYANMFPDRIRTIVADGVVDGVDWSGVRGASKILDTRLGSAASAEAALAKALELCDHAGPQFCENAATDEDPRTAAERLAYVNEALRDGPLTMEYTYLEDIYDEDGNVIDVIEETYIEQLGLADVEASLLSSLYSTDNAAEHIDRDLTYFYEAVRNEVDPDYTLTDEERTSVYRGVTKAKTRALANALNGTKATTTSLRSLDAVKKTVRDETDDADSADEWDDWDDLTEDEIYKMWGDSFAAFSAVTCSDGRHPIRQGDSQFQADEAAKQNPTFGRIWAYGSAQCSTMSWLPSDEDRFMGPFNKQTKNPIMFVGNKYDPATAQAQAEKSAARQPGSVLITSDSWGHTAYGTSDCVTNAVDAYLLDPTKASNATCAGDYVPFSEPLSEDDGYWEDYEGDHSVPVVGFGKETIARVLMQGK